MFDDKSIKEYQNIKVSDDLKKRVMETYENKSYKKSNISFYRYASLIAACFVIVFSSAYLMLFSTSVSVNGTKVSKNYLTVQNNVMGTFSQRNIDAFGDALPIELKAIFETTISVNNGEFSVSDKKTGELLYIGNKYSFKGDVIVKWNVENKDSMSEMKVSNVFYDEIFEVKYDAENNNWGIKKDK